MKGAKSKEPTSNARPVGLVEASCAASNAKYFLQCDAELCARVDDSHWGCRLSISHAMRLLTERPAVVCVW